MNDRKSCDICGNKDCNIPFPYEFCDFKSKQSVLGHDIVGEIKRAGTKFVAEKHALQFSCERIFFQLKLFFLMEIFSNI